MTKLYLVIIATVFLALPNALSANDLTEEYFPLEKVAPKYPRKALINRMNGHCTIEFTVDKKGKTKDHQVKECSDEVFAKSSIKAVKKFRYKPRMENGVAVEVTGVTNRLDFRVQ